MKNRKWRNRFAQAWQEALDERVPGNEDAGTGQEQDIKPDEIFKAQRARESKRLRRQRRRT